MRLLILMLLASWATGCTLGRPLYERIYPDTKQPSVISSPELSEGERLRTPYRTHGGVI